eukprot:3766020-Prorocentrum_lima.AAC.1
MCSDGRRVLVVVEKKGTGRKGCTGTVAVPHGIESSPEGNGFQAGTVEKKGRTCATYGGHFRTGELGMRNM